MAAKRRAAESATEPALAPPADPVPAESAGPGDPAAAEVAAAAEAAVANEAEALAAEAGQPSEPVPEGDRLAALEALLFASAAPLSPARLAGLLGVRPSEVGRLVEERNRGYEAAGHGIRVEGVAGGFQLVTRSDLAPHVRRLRGYDREAPLSPAALETLAIVAYRQPIQKAEVEAIRGVQVGPILRTLIERGLLRVAGRAEALGHPLLYGTTQAFLEHFGLRSVKDLPKTEEAPK